MRPLGSLWSKVFLEATAKGAEEIGRGGGGGGTGRVCWERGGRLNVWRTWARGEGGRGGEHWTGDSS